MSKGIIMRYLVLSFLLLFSTTALAGVPARVPVQGYLTATDGTAVDGGKTIEFRLYDVASGGTAWYTETQIATVDKGNLTVYLGAITPLDINQFRRGTAYLGVTISGESEMQPRLELATVPFAAYAAYAQETAAVPPGAVMMFDLDQCPSGWSALDAARGRALVGVPSGGTRAGTIGTALADLEDRAHVHSVDPVSTTSGLGGGHSHGVDIPVTATGSAGQHSHQWGAFNFTAKAWSTFNSAGSSTPLIDWTVRGGEIGMDTVGGGNHPLAIDDTQTPPTTSYFTTSTGSHVHSVGPLSATSSFASSHTHSVDIGPTQSTPTTTSQVIPYLQLLVCRKD